MQQQARLNAAFERLTVSERQLLTAALAGNHPEHLAYLRDGVIRALARPDLARQS
jgi:hypothetical protein